MHTGDGFNIGFACVRDILKDVITQDEVLSSIITADFQYFLDILVKLFESRIELTRSKGILDLTVRSRRRIYLLEEFLVQYFSRSNDEKKYLHYKYYENNAELADFFFKIKQLFDEAPEDPMILYEKIDWIELDKANKDQKLDLMNNHKKLLISLYKCGFIEMSPERRSYEKIENCINTGLKDILFTPRLRLIRLFNAIFVPQTIKNMQKMIEDFKKFQLKDQPKIEEHDEAKGKKRIRSKRAGKKTRLFLEKFPPADMDGLTIKLKSGRIVQLPGNMIKRKHPIVREPARNSQSYQPPPSSSSNYIKDVTEAEPPNFPKPESTITSSRFHKTPQNLHGNKPGNPHLFDPNLYQNSEPAYCQQPITPPKPTFVQNTNLVPIRQPDLVPETSNYYQNIEPYPPVNPVFPYNQPLPVQQQQPMPFYQGFPQNPPYVQNQMNYTYNNPSNPSFMIPQPRPHFQPPQNQNFVRAPGDPKTPLFDNTRREGPEQSGQLNKLQRFEIIDQMSRLERSIEFMDDMRGQDLFIKSKMQEAMFSKSSQLKNQIDTLNRKLTVGEPIKGKEVFELMIQIKLEENRR